jgi:transcription elongation factor
MVTLIDKEGHVKDYPKIRVKNRITQKFNRMTCFGQNLTIDSTVKVVDGYFSNLIAAVLHIYGEKVFLKVKGQKRNGGVIVVNANSCYLL